MIKNGKGFSLIELLAVILTIGILTSLAIPNYRTSTIKAKIASNMPFLRALQNDMLNFYDGTGNLPTDIRQLSINAAEFEGNVHTPTRCTITIENTPAVKMDCNQGWNMLYSLESTSYGYSLGTRTFNITASGSEGERLKKIANNFGWSGSNNTYTIR